MKTYNPESEQLESENQKTLWRIKNTLFSLRYKLAEAQKAPDEYAQCYVNELQQAIISLDAVKKYF